MGNSRSSFLHSLIHPLNHAQEATLFLHNGQLQDNSDFLFILGATPGSLGVKGLQI